MPEGDTIFRTAATLHRVFAGRVVTRFESVFPALNRIDADHPLAGRTIESVTARGKHLLMTFSGDLTLHTHMRMHGSWHTYRPGQRWQRPQRDMRIVIHTDVVVAVGFNVPVAEFLSPRDLARHRQIGALGPDLLDPAFDAEEAVRRLRARASDAIAEALLDQRALAGVGNVFKSEILFAARVGPFTRVGDLDDEALARIVGVARTQLGQNVLRPAQTLSPASGRRTTRSLDPDVTLWVYGRGGKPCRTCGTRIEVRHTGPDARLTYWCPSCQAAR